MNKPSQDVGRTDGLFRNPDVWIPLILLLSGIAFFSDLIFSSKNLYFRDILNFHYPLRRLLIESFARWEFPLWNPYIYLGQPMLANPNYMTFYPTNLLHLIFSFDYAFKLHFIIHPLIGGLGVYFLQRRLGISALAALGGSLAYQFSGTVLSFLNLYNIVPAVALLPWISWAFWGALTASWLRRTLAFGALVAIQMTAFEPLVFQCEVLFLAGLSLYRIVESRDRAKSVVLILRTAGVGLLFAVCLAGGQILPTLEMLPRTARGGGFQLEDLTGWSMHPMDFLNTFIPNFYGHFYSMGYATSWGESYHQGRESYLVSCFLGTSTLLLASIGLFTVRKRLRWILVTLVLIGAGMALGGYNPLYHWLATHIVLLRFGRFPSKYFLLAALALSLMSSLGLEVLLSQVKADKRKRRQVLDMCLGAIGISLVLLGSSFVWQGQPSSVESWLRSGLDPDLARAKDFGAIVAQLLRSIQTSGAFLLICGILISYFQIRQKSASMVAGAVLLILAAELLPANLGLCPLISSADVDFVPEVNRYAPSRGPSGLFRVSPPTRALLKPMPDLEIRAPNRAAAWLTLFYRRSGQPFYGIMQGIQYSLDRSIDGLNTRDSEALWEASLKLPEAELLSLLERLNTPILLSLDEMKDSRVRLLSTFDTHSNVDLRLYALTKSAPRAFFVSGVETAASHDEALKTYLRPDFPFESKVLLEDSTGADRPGESGCGSAQILNYENRRVVCKVQATAPGYLVLLDSYFPGWRARVDGVEADIVRADFAFRAVAVPAGEHQVEFRYQPRSFFIGLLLTMVAGLGAVIILAFSDD